MKTMHLTTAPAFPSGSWQTCSAFWHVRRSVTATARMVWYQMPPSSRSSRRSPSFRAQPASISCFEQQARSGRSLLNVGSRQEGRTLVGAWVGLCVLVIGACRIMHLHVTQYHNVSYHIITYHIISYHIISYHIISYDLIGSHLKGAAFQVSIACLL